MDLSPLAPFLAHSLAIVLNVKSDFWGRRSLKKDAESWPNSGKDEIKVVATTSPNPGTLVGGQSPGQKFDQ